MIHIYSDVHTLSYNGNVSQRKGILDQKAIPVHPTIGARCEWVQFIEDDI